MIKGRGSAGSRWGWRRWAKGHVPATPGWPIFKGVDLPRLCPVLCPWRRVPTAPLPESFLGHHLGRCGRRGGGIGWRQRTVPRAISPSAAPLSPFLRSNPVVPDVRIQVVWPRLSPAWSKAARFHLHQLPKQRGTSPAHYFASSATPWPPSTVPQALVSTSKGLGPPC